LKKELKKLSLELLDNFRISTNFGELLQFELNSGIEKEFTFEKEYWAESCLQQAYSRLCGLPTAGPRQNGRPTQDHGAAR
jgi:hypothetical protein